MEKKKVVALSVLLVVIIVLILLIWMMFSDTENGIIPDLLDGNGDGNGSQIKRTEWAFDFTQIKNLTAQGYDGEGVIIGIVDSGIDTTHPDLDHINIVAWADYVNQRSEPYDDNGHGTHISGIIAASGVINGIAPKVNMVVVKAISAEGSGSDSDVADGIHFCADSGANVICLSLGGRARFLNLGDQSANACEDVIDEGVFVVAAAGNDGESDDGDVSSPATVNEVIAVGAIDKNKNIASFSSIGDNDGNVFPFRLPRFDPNRKPELVAPGIEITSTYLEDGYAIVNGTSQATAFVAGGIVLLLDAHPDYMNGDSDEIIQFKNVFMDTAEKCPGQNTPHDNYYGYGLINVVDAHNDL